MKKKWLLYVAVAVASVFMASVLSARMVAKDVIKLQDKAYTHYKKGIIEFSHKKHSVMYAEKYPELFKNGCGECHHDKKGHPLTNLKPGDDVQPCIACHSKPGMVPRAKGMPKLNEKEKLTYNAEAYHQNCKGCHKAFNKAHHTKAAPTSCSKCHPKK